MANWYYMEDDNQKGPIAEDLFFRNIDDGIISATTKVWNEDMPEWKELQAIQDTLKRPKAMPSSESGEICGNCGKLFEKKDMIQFDTTWICASCKPTFVNKLKEGDTIDTGVYVYAGFFRRWFAIFIDGILLGIFQAILNGISTVAIASGSSEAAIGVTAFLFLVNIIVAIAYETFFISSKGATPGKMALGVKVISADGGPVSTGQALGRYFAKILSGIILLIGYFMALFNDEHRTLHDNLCNTRVIMK